MKAEMRGALTEDLKLDVVILEPWSLALTQEHSLIMGSDVTQGQRGHRVLEAKAVLIFTRFTLALALVHTENQYLPLLVNLRERSRDELPTELPSGETAASHTTTALQSPGAHQKPVHLTEVA